MKNAAKVVLILILAAAGCDSVAFWRSKDQPEAKNQDEFYLQPLPVQQKQAYAETATGRFISLADFEDSPMLGKGFRQVEHFAILPAGDAGEKKFVVNITRTGSGAMEVSLRPGAKLEYRIPQVHDFSEYTLLMLSIYSRGIRDDMRIRISTDRAGWESLPVLLRDGWNSVLIDLQRLKAMGDFKSRGVRSIGLWFSDSTEPVRINIDDIMLIDNRRDIEPMPKGAQHPSREMRLAKNGLDYTLHLPHRRNPIEIKQCDDGLWRLGANQALLELGKIGDVNLFLPRQSSDTHPQDRLSGKNRLASPIYPMGRRRVGEVEILEHNSIRLRLANTWYFPTEAGEWLSLSVRRIRWEYTFYRDGRWITDVMLNNAGGENISTVRITSPAASVFSDGGRGKVKHVRKFAGLAGRWHFMIAPETEKKKIFEANFAHPGLIKVSVGRLDETECGSGDGFDRSRGCYRLRAKNGHCRFQIIPPAGGVADAVIRVSGLGERKKSTVSANSEGLALRNLVRLPDGSVLFVLPGMTDKPRWVEVTQR